jgi:CheY-like chemotaxis protein
VRILVVDDEAVFREELAELLRDDRHDVASEPSVVKALATLERAEFDLILTDLRMPRRTGLDLLREVRGRWPRTLVVMLTGHGTVETALDAMKLGAFDYLLKPFPIEQLRETLRLVELEREFESPSNANRDPVCEAHSLAMGGQHEVLFFGDPGPAPEPHLHIAPLDPENPLGLAQRTESFLREHPSGAVVVSGIERLLDHHRLEEVVGILDRLRNDLVGHGPLRVGFNPHRVTQSVAVALGAAVSADETHATLDALANPIRRKILQRLAEASASFGAAMQSVGLSDSSKMSFHVRRLVETGLIAREGELYHLTARGDASVRLLGDATFLPPAGTSDNLAFPKRGAGRSKKGAGATKGATRSSPRVPVLPGV